MSIKKTAIELIAPVFVNSGDLIKSNVVDVSTGLSLAVLLWLTKTTTTNDGTDTIFSVEASAADAGDTKWQHLGGELIFMASMHNVVANGAISHGAVTMTEPVAGGGAYLEPGMFAALIGADGAHSEFIRMSGSVYTGPADPGIQFRNALLYDYLNGARIGVANESPCALFQLYQVVGYKRARVVFCNKTYVAKQQFFIRCQGILVEGI